MKLFLFLLWLLALTWCCSAKAQETDPVKQTNAINKQKSKNKGVNKQDADFLVQSADARMMDLQEGRMAREKGATMEVRQYGKLMVKDQALLLKKIRQLAASKQISLPAGISNKKQDGRDDLTKKSGKDFDEKFIKMMTIDHERDISLFKKAIESDDKAISKFATTYLPYIQDHLNKINEVREMIK